MSQTELMGRAGLLRYALPMAAAVAAAVYHLRAALTLVRAGGLAMYRCRAAHHRVVAAALFVVTRQGQHRCVSVLALASLPDLCTFPPALAFVLAIYLSTPHRICISLLNEAV